MKLRIKNILTMMLSVAAASVFAVSCDNTMEEYMPEQFFSLPEHEMNIGLDGEFKVTANCSSVWKLTTKNDWISFPKEYGNTGDTLLVKVIKNRTEAKRTGYVYVETFFKDNRQKDSIAIVQEVDWSPEITPETFEFTFSPEAGNYLLPISYNNSVKVELVSNSPWLTLNQNELPGSDNMVHQEELIVSLTENEGGLRTATLKLTSSGEGNPSVEVKVMQKGKFIPRTAITSFFDEFNECTVKNAPFVSDKWMTACTPEFNLFKCLYFSPEIRYPLIYNANIDGLTGFMVMYSPYNVKKMKNKTMSYTWNRGNLKFHEGGKMEIVASEDFEGDLFSATWTVIEDITITKDNTSGMNHPYTKKDVSLAAFAESESVYIGFRYTGKGGAYRIDNMKVGD